MELESSSTLDFIDELLLKHRVSLLALSDFADVHMDDLQRAERIFDLKEERDGKLCLALFRLLAGKHEAAISESFCNRYNLDTSLDDFSFEKNKLFLLAAFVYNPSFFAMSWNLCGIIRCELALRKELQEETPKQETGSVFSIVPKRRINIGVDVLAASSAGEEMEEIWSGNIAEEGICGKLRISANNKDDAGEVYFAFEFKEYSPGLPFFLQVRYTTSIDRIEHIAKLTIEHNSARKKVLIISSEPQRGIRYGGGITITDIEVLAHD